MKVVDLIDITLHHSSVSQSAATHDYAAATVFGDAETCYVKYEDDDATPRTPVELYTSQQAANQGHYPPDDDGTWWVLSGSSNRWKMFDAYVSSQTEDTSTIVAEIDSNESNAIGLFNLQGSEVTLHQIIDTELATDGDCTDDNFTKGTGWSHDAGNDEYDCSGAQAANTKLYQDMSTTEDSLYRVQFTVKNYDAGNIAGMAGGTAGTNVAADGTYSQVITAGSDAEDGVIADSAFKGSVDDISIMRVVDYTTIDLDVTDIDDYYEYFFNGFLFKEDIFWTYHYYADSRMRIEISTQGGTCACGIVALGSFYELGDTLYEPTIGIADYSKKDTDAYGRTYLNQGAYAKTLDFDILIENDLIDYVNRRLTAVRGEAAIFNANNTGASNTYESMIVYGFFESFSIIIPGPVKSKCNIEVQGLI